MTHVTDERKVQLDAAAEERAAYLEEVKHPVAGLHVQSLIDEPEPYHAGQLTPAYHVPGNVEPEPEVSAPSGADLDSIAAEKSAKEATQGEPVDPTASNQSESAPIAEPDTASQDVSVLTEEQEQPSGNV